MLPIILYELYLVMVTFKRCVFILCWKHCEFSRSLEPSSGVSLFLFTANSCWTFCNQSRFFVCDLFRTVIHQAQINTC